MIHADWLIWTIAGAATGCCALWAFSALRMLARARLLPIAEQEEADPPEQWPLLSVVIPACNEVTTLDSALQTLRAQHYPNLEILLIDDRSTDGTAALVDRLAAEDTRIRALHVNELPPRWLGKVHALNVGSQQARGEWLLFTDADVHFAEGALEGAVSLAMGRGFDHLVLAPDISSRSFMTNLVLATVWFGVFGRTNIKKLLDPAQPDAAGSGAFNLVKRETLERGGGFEWLRMEIFDDFGLGLAVKKAGGRIGLMFSQRWVKVAWYESFGEVIRGMSKNAFAMFGHFNLGRVIFGIYVFLALVFTPPLIFLLQPGWLWAGPLLAYSLMVLSGLYIYRKIGCSPWPAFLWPLAFVLFAFVGASSLRSVWRKGGIEWRGTVYSLAELRAHQRVWL